MPHLPRPARATVVRQVTGVAGLLALAAVTTAAAPGALHVVRGDTLSQLAQRYGTTVAALQAANGLAGDRILAGQTLVLPAARAATTTARTVEQTHVVVAGETVEAVARAAGTSVRSVLARNGLTATSLLQPGQRLVVPVTVRVVGGGTTPTTATTTATGSTSASAAQHRAVLAARPVPDRSAVRAMIGATARRYGVDPSLALAVSYQESGFQQRVVSGVDAVGVMQVLPSTGAGLSRAAGRDLDLLRTEDNVAAGVLLLRQLLQGAGSEHAALAGYYQGIGSVARQGVLPQTVQYIRNVDALRARFRSG